MNKFSKAQLVLILGIAVFFLPKVYFIIGQTAGMGMARLGDDAYVHLWRAEQISDIGFVGMVSGETSSASRGLHDIVRLCEEGANNAPLIIRNRCARVVDNIAAPDVKAGASLLLNGVLKLGLSLKWSYAIYETIIAAFITGGFAFFLVRLFDVPSAGVGLVLLAFINLLGPQGLHQFIPSTLVIGLSVALLGGVAGSSVWRHYAFAAAGFAVLSIVHPVAIMFGVALGPLALLGLWPLRNRKAVVLTLVGAAVVFAVFVSASSVIRNVLVDAFSTDLSANLLANLNALPVMFYKFFLENWAVVAAFAGSLFWFRRLVPKIAIHVGLALLLLLAASLLHKTEFFIFNIRLDLFARIFVAFAVLGCGYLALVITRVGWNERAWRRAGVCLFVGLLIMPSAVSWMDSFYRNMNGRREVIEDGRLEGFIEKLGKRTTLAYGELDITPNAAFIAGADRLGAIPMSGLTPHHLQRVMAKRKPELLALPNFRALNVLATTRSQSLERRRHGFPASAIDMIAVTPKDGVIESVYLYLENIGAGPARVAPISYITTAGKRRQGSDIVIAPGERKWVEVSFGVRNSARTAIFELPQSDLWVTGISVNSPAQPGVFWPWDERAVVQWLVRGTPDSAIKGIAFELPRLLRHWRTTLPGSLPMRRVVSDSSGIVFIEMAYPRSP